VRNFDCPSPFKGNVTSTVLVDGRCWYGVVSVEFWVEFKRDCQVMAGRRRSSEGDGFVFEEWDKEMRCPPCVEDEQVDGFKTEHFC
jgi:hypothetical protein